MNSKRRKKSKIDPKDYEGYSYGPLRLERIGQTIRMGSNWKPGQFEVYIQRVRNKRPDFKREINKKISELVLLIKQFEPLELLSAVSIRNCFGNLEGYKEITHEGKESYVEYAQSLILSQKRNPEVKHVTQETIEEFNNLIKEIFNNVLWYFGSEFAEGKRNQTEEELRFISIARYLFVRGDSFEEHHLEMVKDIFKDHNMFLEKHYGFTSDEVIRSIQHIEEQLLNNIRKQVEFVSVLHELHELFKEFADKESIDSFSSFEDYIERYRNQHVVQEKIKKFEELINNLNENPFEIVPTKEAPIELLNLLSAHFGDNSEFVTFRRSPGWPTNDSIIYDRPLIEDNGKFYCFSPQVLFRNIGNILERWIKQKDEEYFEETYQKKRAQYLENKALRYLKKILPESKSFGKLFYWVKENGVEKRVETDGLVFYDTHLFIIEAKAGTYSTSARRGSLERMKKNAEELVDNAYKQALRTKDYIMNTPEPTFELQDGSKAIVIKDKHKYKNIYLVNVTLENLGVLSTQLHSLKNFNFIQGKEWPWSVFINDLRVISEIIEFPSEFLHFLQGRIRANNYPQFYPMDELVFLMFYFKKGLYFGNGVLKNVAKYTPLGYTEELNRHYDYLASSVSSGRKPYLKIPREYKDFIRKIELTGKDGFTEVTLTLLNVDSKTRQMILGNLRKIKDAFKRDGRPHDFIILLEEPKMGLMVLVSGTQAPDFWSQSDRFCYLKMYQTRSEKWILMTIELQKNGKENLDFRIYNKKWEYDPNMEEQLKKFRETKWAHFEKTGRKIGRNDPCPCGSGLKYKKCCGR